MVSNKKVNKMKVIHIESGLGNQMLSYCEYLALKKMNPNDKFYLETMIFDIPDCNDVICQWNGYELQRIFGINEPPNIKELFSDAQWNSILEEVKSSKFWEKKWNYPVYITKALNDAGLDIINFRGDFENDNPNNSFSVAMQFIQNTCFNIFPNIKSICNKLFEKRQIAKFYEKDKVFCKTSANLFTGQRLALYRRDNGIELIEKEIRDTFIFPEFEDQRNKETAVKLNSCNSVSVHVRRGDAMGTNAWIYKSGYFKRAVKYVKKNVHDPVFFFFTDPGSIEWCKQNQKKFGLNFSKDKVYFIDWNKGLESYRDMQLMTYCKHSIQSYSSFGWWGAYLMKNPNKIVISPIRSIVATHYC